RPSKQRRFALYPPRKTDTNIIIESAAEQFRCTFLIARNAAYKPRQIVCVGFVGQGRVRAPFFFLRDTGRNRARQVFSLVIASTISLTAKEKPR
ncbi:hypothetical protein, partial [Ruminococcus sp.]|uniref:hypothetical protein n=1 Tax=Ruminococcus sp. TaxID=41978 RepID=UPI002E78E452